MVRVAKGVQVVQSVGARDFRGYFMSVRRRWPVVLIGLIVGVVAGAVAVTFVPSLYTASSKVSVDAVPSDVGAVAGGRTQGQVNLDTEAQVAKSDEVAARVADSLGLSWSPAEVAARIAITVPPNTSVLRFTFRSETPAEAELGANAVARSYLENRRHVAEDFVSDQAEKIAKALAEVDEKLQGTEDEVTRAALRATRARLLSSLAELESTVITPGRVLSDAVRPSAPDVPRPWMLWTSLVSFGLLLGLAAAYLLDRRAGLINSVGQITASIGLPIVAELKRGFEDDPVGSKIPLMLIEAAVSSREPGRRPTACLSGVPDGSVADSVAAALKDLTAPREMAEAGSLSVSVVPRRTDKALVGGPTGSESKLLIWTCDSPATSHYALDTVRQADATLFCCRLGHTKLDELRVAVDHAVDVGADLRGIVVIGFD